MGTLVLIMIPSTLGKRKIIQLIIYTDTIFSFSRLFLVYISKRMNRFIYQDWELNLGFWQAIGLLFLVNWMHLFGSRMHIRIFQAFKTWKYFLAYSLKIVSHLYHLSCFSLTEIYFYLPYIFVWYYFTLSFKTCHKKIKTDHNHKWKLFILFLCMHV